MSQTAGPGASPTFDELVTGIAALADAAKQLGRVSREIETAHGPSSNARLLAEEVRDVRARVAAEREKLASTLPGVD